MTKKAKKSKSMTNSELTASYKKLRKEQNRDNRRIELKYFETNTDFVDIDWVGNISATFCIPIQGLTKLNRIADKIYLRGLYIKGLVNCGPNVRDPLNVNFQPNIVRILVVLDKANNNTLINDFLDTPNTNFAPYALYNKDTRPNWTVLFDRMYTVDYSRGINQLINKYIKINKPSHFEGPVLISKNAIKIMVCSNINPTQVNDSKPTVKLFTRATFTDE